MPIYSKFIVIEGLEGAGKSTIIQSLKTFFAQHENSTSFIFTREPGGTQLAEKIRNLALQKQQNEILCKESELLLMYASRIQHVNKVILPALNQNKWVISDRFYLSTFAYQGGGRMIDINLINNIHNAILNNFKPGLTLFLDVDPITGLKRIQSRNNIDRIESEKIDFFQRARKAYLKNIKLEPKFEIVDANDPIEKVLENIKTIINQYYLSVNG